MRTQGVKSEPSSTSLYVNVGLEVVYNRGGFETRERNRDFKKRENVTKAYTESRKIGMV